MTHRNGIPDGWIEDPKTLKATGVANIHIVQKIRSPFGNGWMSMSQEAFKVLATHGRAIGVDGFRVLSYLLSTLTYDNRVCVSQTETGRMLGMKQQHVSRAIKRLVTVGALLEGDREGLYRSYRLNPEFGWKGSSKDHHTALRRHAGSEADLGARSPGQPSTPG